MRNNKKGFTIVELVIVIAVIGILAAVLIPTFGSVVENAQRSGALQEAKVAMEMVSMEENAQLKGTYYVVCEEYVFEYNADGNGITDQKPVNFTKVSDTNPEVKSQSQKVTEAVGEFADGKDLHKYITATKKLTYYISNKAEGKASDFGVTYTPATTGDNAKPASYTVAGAQVKTLDDFSTNVVVIGIGEAVESTNTNSGTNPGGDNQG